MSVLMRAAVLDAPGIPKYAEFARLNAPEGGVSVKVRLAGVNPIDLLLATQQGAGFPRVPGSEGVGLSDQGRVYFSAAPGRNGSMAEYSVALSERTYPVPDALADEMAVALGIGGLTAYLSLASAAKVQPGETVLVLGASGVVGGLAVQLAKILGAGRVVAAARSEHRLTELASLGADATVRIDPAATVSDLAERFTDATDGRLDVIIDPVWGDPAAAALLAATRYGRLVQLGHSATASINFAPAFLRGKAVSILGYSSGIASPELRRETYLRLCDLASAGMLQMESQVLPLSSVREAWDRQARSPNVKLCLDVRGSSNH